MWILWAACVEHGGKTGDSSVEATGEYEDGVYHCCAEGDGVDCCDIYEPGMCFEYGGIYGACIGEGEMFEAKVLCAFCCDGLSQISLDETSSDGCVSNAPPSMLLCAACGDGACGTGENECNCPEDCSAP